MRLCTRNLKRIYFATYQGKVEIKDSDGNDTGRSTPSYSNPEELIASVSAARGTADTEQFGVNLDYEKVVITDNLTLPISETSVLWVDSLPNIKPDGSTETPFDYEVVKVAESVNYVSYAIKKVNVS